MSDVTVKQLASDVNIPEDVLLAQLKEAGVSKSTCDDPINESEKAILLAHLRESHGKKGAAAAGSGKKITLKRKTVSELQQPRREAVRLLVARPAVAEKR